MKKIKVTQRIADNTKAVRLPSGLTIDFSVMLTRDQVKEIYTGTEIPLDEIFADGKTQRRVHVRVTGPTWDMLRRANLAPCPFGVYTLELCDLDANRFTTSDGEVRTHLTAKGFTPLKSEGGVPAAPSSELLKALPPPEEKAAPKHDDSDDIR